MKRFIIFLTLNLMLNYGIAIQLQGDYTCPEIKVCSFVDGAKLNLAYFKNNESAYNCYRANGDMDMANKAGISSSRCQVIFATVTATVKPLNN